MWRALIRILVHVSRRPSLKTAKFGQPLRAPGEVEVIVMGLEATIVW